VSAGPGRRVAGLRANPFAQNAARVFAVLKNRQSGGFRFFARFSREAFGCNTPDKQKNKKKKKNSAHCDI